MEREIYNSMSSMNQSLNNPAFASDAPEQFLTSRAQRAEYQETVDMIAATLLQNGRPQKVRGMSKVEQIEQLISGDADGLFVIPPFLRELINGWIWEKKAVIKKMAMKVYERLRTLKKKSQQQEEQRALAAEIETIGGPVVTGTTVATDTRMMTLSSFMMRGTPGRPRKPITEGDTKIVIAEAELKKREIKYKQNKLDRIQKQITLYTEQAKLEEQRAKEYVASLSKVDIEHEMILQTVRAHNAERKYTSASNLIDQLRAEIDQVKQKAKDDEVKAMADHSNLNLHREMIRKYKQETAALNGSHKIYYGHHKFEQWYISGLIANVRPVRGSFAYLSFMNIADVNGMKLIDIQQKPVTSFRFLTQAFIHMIDAMHTGLDQLPYVMYYMPLITYYGHGMLACLVTLWNKQHHLKLLPEPYRAKPMMLFMDEEVCVNEYALMTPMARRAIRQFVTTLTLRKFKAFDYQQQSNDTLIVSVLDSLAILTNYDFLTQPNYFRRHIGNVTGITETVAAIAQLFPIFDRAQGQDLTTANMFVDMFDCNREYRPLESTTIYLRNIVNGVDSPYQMVLPLTTSVENEAITEEVANTLGDLDYIAQTFHQGVTIEDAARERYELAEINQHQEIYYDVSGRVIELFRNMWIMDAEPELIKASVNLIEDYFTYKHQVDKPQLPPQYQRPEPPVEAGNNADEEEQKAEQVADNEFENVLMADEQLNIDQNPVLSAHEQELIITIVRDEEQQDLTEEVKREEVVLSVVNREVVITPPIAPPLFRAVSPIGDVEVPEHSIINTMHEPEEINAVKKKMLEKEEVNFLAAHSKKYGHLPMILGSNTIANKYVEYRENLMFHLCTAIGMNIHRNIHGLDDLREMYIMKRIAADPSEQPLEKHIRNVENAEDNFKKFERMFDNSHFTMEDQTIAELTQMIPVRHITEIPQDLDSLTESELASIQCVSCHDTIGLFSLTMCKAPMLQQHLYRCANPVCIGRTCLQCFKKNLTYEPKKTRFNECPQCFGPYVIGGIAQDFNAIDRMYANMQIIRQNVATIAAVPNRIQDMSARDIWRSNEDARKQRDEQIAVARQRQAQILADQLARRNIMRERLRKQEEEDEERGIARDRSGRDHRRE